MKFIQARNYTPVSHREIDLLVIHDMEAPEKPDTAEGVANFFHNQLAGPNGSSAHYCLDNNSVVACVRDHDVAWAAPGANHDGLHFEFTGYASQTDKQWHDRFDQEMFQIGAHLFARKAKRYGIPRNIVDPDELKKGKSGITTHLYITESGIGGPSGTHRDPGEHFPLIEFRDEVRSVYKHLYG